MHRRPLHRLWFATALLAMSGATLAAPDGGSSTASKAAAPIEISESATIHASAATVWNTVADFDSVSVWVPAIDASRLNQGQNNRPGAVRHIVFTTGESADERLLSWDGKTMRYTYRMTAGPFGMTSYVSTVAVQATGATESRLIWEARFQPAPGTDSPPLRQAIRKVYVDALEQVRQMVSVQAD